jgi:hypothetical protein
MPAAPWCILAQGLVPEQHRVKNNFQIILASIAIQKHAIPPATLKARWTTSPAASTRFHWPTIN